MRSAEIFTMPDCSGVNLFLRPTSGSCGRGKVLAGEHQLDPGDNMVILTRKLVTGDAVVNETIVQFIEG